MQLAKKKALAAKALNVGKGRIVFVNDSLKEIAEAITRQDIIDLYNSGAIRLHEINGRKKIVRRKHRRGVGKRKLPVKRTKQEYVIMTRKLRSHTKHLLKTSQIDKDQFLQIRKMIRAKRFKSKRHLVESLGEI